VIAQGRLAKNCNKEAGMPRTWFSQKGPERLGEMLGTIFLVATLALFLYGYLRHFL
jgi:hypothetical protein